MAGSGGPSKHSVAFLAAGLILFWGALMGALDTIAFHGASFASFGVRLQYAVAEMLLQSLIGLPVGLALWAALELASRNDARPSALALAAAQVAAVALPIAMGLLTWFHETLMGGAPALSAGGIGLTLLVLGGTFALGAIVARRLARSRGVPGATARRLAAAGWALLLATGATVAASSADAGGDAPGAQPASVVLISIDSLRADTWARYVAAHASPTLRDFVAGSRRFHHAYTTWSHSLASHASMLSGLYPFEHGGVLQKVDGNTLGSPVRPEVELLAERLSARGFQTAAFIANPWLGPPWRLEAGFETYVNGSRAGRIESFSPVLLGSVSLVGSYLRFFDQRFVRGVHPNTRLFRDWLERRDRDRPFFGFLHFIEMHVPHEPPREVAARFSGGRFAGIGGREAARRIESGEIAPEDMPELIEHLHGLGLAMLSEMDRLLSPALEALREQRLLESTLVILTSDHGDNFYEKAGSYSHVHVYDTIAHVPLTLHVPGDGAGGSDHDALVSVVDLAPTIYGFTGVAGPERQSGIDLLDPGALASARGRPVFVQGSHPDGGYARAIITTGHKLIENPDGSRELYDRRADPRETRNLSAEQPERAGSLARQLAAAFAAGGAQGAEPVDIDELPPDAVEQLRGLGYIE